MLSDQLASLHRPALITQLAAGLGSITADRSSLGRKRPEQWWMRSEKNQETFLPDMEFLQSHGDSLPSKDKLHCIAHQNGASGAHRHCSKFVNQLYVKIYRRNILPQGSFMIPSSAWGIARLQSSSARIFPVWSQTHQQTATANAGEWIKTHWHLDLVHLHLHSMPNQTSSLKRVPWCLSTGILDLRWSRVWSALRINSRFTAHLALTFLFAAVWWRRCHLQTHHRGEIANRWSPYRVPVPSQT